MSDQPFFIPAVIILGVSVPLILRLIPRNRFYGIRTRKTLLSDNQWYSINRTAGIVFVISSLVYIFSAILYPYSKMAKNDFQIWLVHLAAFLIPLLISLYIIRTASKN